MESSTSNHFSLAEHISDSSCPHTVGCQLSCIGKSRYAPRSSERMKFAREERLRYLHRQTISIWDQLRLQPTCRTAGTHEPQNDHKLTPSQTARSKMILYPYYALLFGGFGGSSLFLLPPTLVASTNNQIASIYAMSRMVLGHKTWFGKG